MLYCRPLDCSAAVEIVGTMGVDAFVARTGLRMMTTLHSSVRADGKIQLKNGRVFNMDINWPEDKMEFVNIEYVWSYVTHLFILY